MNEEPHALIFGFILALVIAMAVVFGFQSCIPKNYQSATAAPQVINFIFSSCTQTDDTSVDCPFEVRYGGGKVGVGKLHITLPERECGEGTEGED